MLASYTLAKRGAAAAVPAAQRLMSAAAAAVPSSTTGKVDGETLTVEVRSIRLKG
jgi:hypothetical protein